MERYVIVIPADEEQKARLVRCDDGDTCKLETLQTLVGGPIETAESCLAANWAREDVDSIVEATDAGREGELIFRLVYLQSGCRKPFERLWISSMEDAAIREGFARLQPSAVYDALYQSELCRERADWMVGINATRLFSCLYGGTLNIGRVMTPTLALTVEREKEIASFVSVPFYTVTLHLPGFDAVTGDLKHRAKLRG